MTLAATALGCGIAFASSAVAGPTWPNAWPSIGAESAAVKPGAGAFTAKLVRDLKREQFQVTRGYPVLWTAQDCDLYTYPVLKNCQGNNPVSPYVMPVVRNWPDEFVDPAMRNAFVKTPRGYSGTYRLDPREAIVIYGQLPPPGRYMGLQSWVGTKKWLTTQQPWDPAAYERVASVSPLLANDLFAKVPDKRLGSRAFPA